MPKNNKKNNEFGDVALYQSPDGDIQLDVTLKGETIWLTQEQMVTLFGRDRSVISRHIRNVFSEAELDEKSNLQKMQFAFSDKPVTFYSLDVIISVGYRLKYNRGTQFRIWATRTLKEHLIRGYTLNERRLAEQGVEIGQVIELLSRTLTNHAFVTEEGRDVLDVVQQYTRVWRLLLEYDEDRLTENPARPIIPGEALSLETTRKAIAGLRYMLATRGQATSLFGHEREDALDRVLCAIEQTFGGEPLYSSAQIKAAHLLYFVIKDHPFSDGNKRIGTLLFLEYLKNNRLLFKPDGSPRLSDNAMVAIALLVAESNPVQKDLMIRLIVNLLEDTIPME